MKTCLALASALIVLTLAPLSRSAEIPRDPDAVPEGLNASDWSSIRAAYDAGRHGFFKQADGTHLAHNPGQQWQMTFDDKGFTATPADKSWTWGLEYVADIPVGSEAKNADRNAGNTLSFPRTPHLTEWFINDSRGLEQGWTLSARAPIHLRVRGTLKATVSQQSISFGSLITYSGLKAWDATGKAIATHFEATAEGFSVCYDDTGARYPITIDPIAQQAYLKAFNTDAGDQFGSSVAVSGDTVVVAAPVEASNATGVNGNQADNSTSGAGAVYVFVRSGTLWSQQAYLKASNTGMGDNFGVSVAVAGNTVVVGASGEASNATGVNGNQADNSSIVAGAAYVFVRSGTLWSQQAYLKASNTGGNDRFGTSVAVAGDTVVVGANQEASNATGVNGNQADNSAGFAGAAYVFVRSSTLWSQQAYLKASNTGGGDEFGRSVAVAGDTVVVGALGESSNATGVNGNQANNSASAAGAAYVFVRSGTQWSQQTYLKASNTGGNDRFGFSVAVACDTVVVGANGESSNATGVNGNQADNSASDAGAAYVFVRSGTLWSQQAYLKASNSEGGDLYGYSVAVAGDTLVVGAFGEASNATGVNGNQADNSAFFAGAAYVYVRSGTLWSQQTYLKASNTGVSDGFGLSVAVAGDMVVVGAYGEDSNATGINGNQADNSAGDAGAAYIFRGIGLVLPTLSRTTSPAPGAADIAFSTPGFPAVNGQGEAMFDQALSGAGSTLGRNHGVFSTLALNGTVDMAFQKGTSLAGVGGYAVGSTASALAPPLCNQNTQGIFQVTATGTGVTTSNNKLLLRDDGFFVSFVRRTGTAVTELGGAEPSAFNETLQSHDQDLIVIPHTLKLSVTPTPDVIAANDTGLLLLNHAGVLVNPTPPREGDPTNPKYGTEAGTLGQFTGRAAAGLGDTVHFGALFKPTVGTPVPALFFTKANGTVTGRTAKVGDTAPGAIPATAKFASFPALSQLGANALYLATLSGALAANNQGLWEGNTRRVLKGDVVDAIPTPDVVIASIIKFWPVGSDQIVLQVTLSGGGVTAANNSALLLRQSDGALLVLMRTGADAPGACSAKVLAIQAVDVDPVNGHYAVTGSLSGTATTNNQALWAGQTSLGDNTLTNRQLRLPFLRLRKGDSYRSTETLLGTIMSLTLKPAVDITGAGGRGLAKAVGSGGHAAVYILTDSSVTELVLLKL